MMAVVIVGFVFGKGSLQAPMLVVVTHGTWSARYAQKGPNPFAIHTLRWLEVDVREKFYLSYIDF